MAKPEWGTKRICQSCSAPFYDLRRDPIVCPKCNATFDPEAVLKSRRARGVEEEVTEKPKKEADTSDVDLEVEEDEEAGEDEDDDVLEDASDLGDDDMSDVIDTSDDEEDS
ncbi:MAG: TIGR02300 family protein [Rhodospirillales bacterium]|nr:MAG: TIGR02300 family protein [Rhodospirillales bacterium]